VLPPQVLSSPPQDFATALASLLDAFVSLLATSTVQSVEGGRLPFTFESSQPTSAFVRAPEYFEPSFAIARSHFAQVLSLAHPVGTLFGSAGSEPPSRSLSSRKPSPSWSTPMRSPEPGGTAVNVSSWPAVAASARSAAFVIG